MVYWERMISTEEREQERALFEAERKRAPHLFERAPMVDSDAYLKWVGIAGLPPDRPTGYLRLFPQDFIVEEISPDGALHTVDVAQFVSPHGNEGPTLYADLVKIGISTLEAKEQLASLLGIDSKHIGFAGIKDRLAITSQRISIRNLRDLSKLEALGADNFFLKNISIGKGVVANGDLQGNCFLITVRFSEPMSHEGIRIVREQLGEIRRNGFWNFFYTQRFGTPRLISHWLGLLLIKGEYEEVVKTFCTYAAPRELPYFQQIRKEIAGLWGHWPAVRERLAAFPYHFNHELKLITHLSEHPRDFVGALRILPDQIRLWFYAYDCFLFNRKLSQLIKEGEVPVALPLATSFNSRDWEPYRDFLDADDVKLPSRSYKDFPFVRVGSRTWPTLQRAEIHGIAVQERLAVFGFSLPKGSYATSFLMNFFILAAGLPVVPEITAMKVDAKELLGLGTLAPALERFRTVLEQREEDIDAGAE